MIFRPSTETFSVMEKLTMSVIARSAFGIDLNAFTDEESRFVKHAENLFNTTLADPEVVLIRKSLRNDLSPFRSLPQHCSIHPQDHGQRTHKP